MPKRSSPSLNAMFGEVGQVKEVTELKDKVGELEAEIERLRAEQSQSSSEENTELQKKIEELTIQLAERGGVHEITLDRIQLDPEQPRQIYPESIINERAESLRREGQLSPVILIPLDDGTYRLFDGHLRHMAAPRAGLETLKAVFRKASDPIETFDRQLTTSIQSEKLHDLDLAAALIKLIHHRTGLAIDDIPSLTSNAVYRLRRSGNLRNLPSIQSAAVDIQLQWLQNQGLEDVQQQIFQIILGKSLNPATINSHAFPLLKLPKDVQEAMKRGLEPSKAKEIAKLTSEKLNTSKASATKIRKSLADEALDSLMPLSEVKKRVRSLIQENRKKASSSSTDTSGQSVDQAIAYLSNFDSMVDTIDAPDELEALRLTLTDQLKRIEEKLQGLTKRT